MNNIINKNLGIWLMLLLLSCKGFVEIGDPKDEIGNEKVYLNDETATSAIRGIYAQMMSNYGFASGSFSSVTFLAGRSADEFTNFNADDAYIQFSVNNVFPDNTYLRSGLWQEPYKYIYYANLALENLSRSENVSDNIRRQLQGEAKFIRSFCYFYLTNLFGDIPLVLTTNYKINATASASNQMAVYKQIIKDLLDAKGLLGEEYPSVDRVRPNKWAATALLARVYLYTKDWVDAEKESSEVIAQTDTYQILNDLDGAFLKNSKEAILQFAVPQSLGVDTKEGNLFILIASPGSSSQVGLSADLVGALEPLDSRRVHWIGTYTEGNTSWNFPYKYKVKFSSGSLNEYSMVLRLAEQYLIRAEARTMQANFEGALEDINLIRKRAGLKDLTVDTRPDLLTAIEKERRVELFAEWGHRWLDLKRTNRADEVLGVLKFPGWKSTDVLYPIPQTEITNNKNLTQNKGY